MSEVLVSISCITYNHSAYIRQCLDGMLMQQTTFDFEILIHDDCSTDGTDNIIREYEQRYPHVVKPLYETENQYQNGKPFGSIVWNIPRANGKYIAFCEGDDYWTDPLKLQKQVDFMEANPEVGLCYTDYNRLEDETNQLVESLFEKQKAYRSTSYEEFLLKPGYLAPMTWLYRRNLQDMLSLANIHSDGTYAYMLEFLHNSKVAYIPEVTATYRSHVGSASSPIRSQALFRYSIGVFRTQIHYSQKYPCTEELKKKVLMRGYLAKLPIAIMANNEEFVQEARDFMESQGFDVDLIIRELKQGEMRKNSYAYRLGKKLLEPIKWLRNKKNYGK